MYNFHHSSIYNTMKCTLHCLTSQTFVLISIPITHHWSIDGIIPYNLLCIVYEHLLWLPKTESFSKEGLLALNMVSNNRTPFKVRSTIKIQSSPHPYLGQSLTLTGYSSGLRWLIWSHKSKTVLISSPLQLSDPCHCSCFLCSLVWCNGKREISNSDIDWNWKRPFGSSLTVPNKLCRK